MTNEDGRQMKIKFVQSGGYAGLMRGCEMDASSLTNEASESFAFLRNLLTTSGGTIREASAGKDLTVYNIEVTEGDRSETISFDDMTIPKQLFPLLEHLIESAKPLKP